MVSRSGWHRDRGVFTGGFLLTIPEIVIVIIVVIVIVIVTVIVIVLIVIVIVIVIVIAIVLLYISISTSMIMISTSTSNSNKQVLLYISKLNRDPGRILDRQVVPRGMFAITTQLYYSNRDPVILSTKLAVVVPKRPPVLHDPLGPFQKPWRTNITITLTL